ncbi:MAG: PDZ domain-containing protein [Phycisphaerales bacterium]|nr:PDZ domain-containing protein [Phycisphaerales bacterium]
MMMKVRGGAAAVACVAGLAVSALGQDGEPSPTMMRYPDISATQIVFLYANNLWIAPREGGVAVPVASPPGAESFPRFSPDGKTLAFGGNYDGSRDLYTIPVTGGVPARVTHHPAGETLCDWTADGKLTFLSSGMAGLSRQSQIFTVPAAGGMPTKLPVPYAGFGAVSPDGQWLCYAPHSTDNRTWKRYRGGMATDLWLFNLRNQSAKKITDWEGTDTLPMWVPGGKSDVVYYLSDAGEDHRLNIWSYGLSDGKREQITKYTSDDVRWPSVGPGPDGKGEIIFQLGAQLRVLDLGTRQDRVVKITVPGDKPSVRKRTVDAARNIGAASISPSGKRVVIQGRGDLWSAPAKEGITRNLTATTGVFERDPAWSPDNKWIAYLSDESGEYELWIRPTDAKPPEEKKDDAKKDEKKGEADAKKDEQKDGENKDEAKKDEPKREPRKLTNLGPGFRSNPTWSPDSKHIAFTDNAGNLHLINVESGELKTVDTDPWGDEPQISWSHDSNWIAYPRSEGESPSHGIWVYNVKTGEKKQVVSAMFNNSSPAFDRAGDFLYFVSNRTVNSPVYSDVDTTFVYTNTANIYMAPLRADVKYPWLPKSDEEELKKEEKKDDAKKDDSKKDEAKKDEAKKDEPKKDEGSKDAATDDGVSGTWEGKATGGSLPPDGIPFKLTLTLHSDGKVTGTVTSAMGSGSVNGTYTKDSGAISLSVTVGDGVVTMNGQLKNGEITGNWTAEGEGGSWNARRSAAATGGDAASDDKKEDKKDEKKEVKIDVDGFEGRCWQLPIAPGNFGNLAVTDDNKLVYARFGSRGSQEGPSIKIFDPKDDAREEKTVTGGAAGFQLSADGKKMLVFRGGSLTVMNPTPGGGTATSVPTGDMQTTLDPKAEWRQIVTDAWRLQRDFFYEPTMHGVDWPAIKEHYLKMVDDCVTRDDVNYVIAEMISELNIGHAYLGAPGDVEGQQFIGTGVLGCDFELVTTPEGTAYKITRIYEGGPWDADARNPLRAPGVDVKEGEFLLAVNGVPVDTDKDPWAAFQYRADETVALTIGKTPARDKDTREVLVKTLGSDGTLRYRAWIERNRKYVAEKTGGKVGYIYVPNTGVDGQNDLFRQFAGQFKLPALIIDERWNGGGQIPTRFIELLNRPVVSYWARRHGKDWTWPPDGHNGPKCMLINGLAGSGGDMFPWLFKLNKIGKTIGTRTWGGLVGISGNPGLIDGGSITVPTFGIYETDGTWAVEGHGVDPDIEVIDDPSKMVDGGDPQLDAAIQHMLEELEKNPYKAPARPKSPDRKGMGITNEDK